MHTDENWAGSVDAAGISRVNWWMQVVWDQRWSDPSPPHPNGAHIKIKNACSLTPLPCKLRVSCAGYSWGVTVIILQLSSKMQDVRTPVSGSLCFTSRNFAVALSFSYLQCSSLCEVHLWSEHLVVTAGRPFCGSRMSHTSPHRSPIAIKAIYSIHIWEVGWMSHTCHTWDLPRPTEGLQGRPKSVRNPPFNLFWCRNKRQGGGGWTSHRSCSSTASCYHIRHLARTDQLKNCRTLDLSLQDSTEDAAQGQHHGAKSSTQDRQCSHHLFPVQGLLDRCNDHHWMSAHL